MKSFINECNWEGINYPSEKDDQKKFEKNYLIIALIALYTKKEKISPAYISKYNSNSEKQVIILMFPSREEWHYIAEKTVICIIKRNNAKTRRRFLLFKLFSLF